MARKYRVTVNGKAYDVDVEEMGAGAPAAAPGAAATATPAEALTPHFSSRVVISLAISVTGKPDRYSTTWSCDNDILNSPYK